MELTLYAVDELLGFIRSVALVRSTKSLDDVTPRSVRCKMRDKGFAKDVNREGGQPPCWSIRLDDRLLATGTLTPVGRFFVGGRVCIGSTHWTLNRKNA